MIFNRIGFTLVEIMIVMVVIGMLSVALFPQVTGYIARWRDTERISGIKQISIAVSAYQIKNQILPTWTWAGNMCINKDVLIGFYIQRFPIDPIDAKMHWGCNISWMFGYGTWKILTVNKAVFSAYLENPNGGNTGTIDEYQGDAKIISIMNEINFLKKWSGSWYVVHN